ncbi:MAG: ATP-binding protein [Streptococcaceae bacterium]|jgi:predicted AAA+ superfamily ATPase|nr:ATP-binding protein [Streptococcaceae bacterium]
MIDREEYLQKIIDFKDSEFIKVLTGVRRSGKSYLLLMYQKYLLDNGVSKEQIIYLNFESFQTEELQNAKSLHSYLVDNIIKDKKMYILLDEIQYVKEWQKVINSARVEFDCDLTITGSNANMLSGELATLLAGRYIEVKVYPFSFKEFLLARFGEDVDQRYLPRYLKEYIRFGGFPAVVLSDEKMKDTILSGIFDTVILNDVASRGEIKDIEILRRVISFLAGNVGQIVSTLNISNTLTSANMKISHPTVNKYIELMKNAYLLYGAQRYDIRGKQYLSKQEKYYLVDPGLRHIMLDKKQDNRGQELENIVYLELIRRGYTVEVGKYGEREIDFIARKFDELLYVQVAYQLPEFSTRETDNLLIIKDNFRKIVITQSLEEQTEIDGIPIVNVIDWLIS